MKLRRLLCLNNFFYSLFLFIVSLNILISGEIKGLSQKGFNVFDRDVSYSRGIYLIVASNQNILNNLNSGPGGDFIQFKNSQGYDVVEWVVSDGISSEELRDDILSFYSDNPLLEYVLLIGDVNVANYTIPTFTIPSINENELDVTDYNYTYSDDPLNPYFLIGRWSVRSLSELWKVKAKTIQYTRLDNIDDYSYLNRALLVAGNFSGDDVPPYQWPVTPVWTSKWLQNELEDKDYSSIDTAFFHQGNYTEGDINPLIASSWNNGVGIINYRGWGDANGWHKPYFHKEELGDLLPSWKLPIVFSFVCNTGDFGNDYGGVGLPQCFGESLIIEGASFSSPKGAAAMIGPSDLDTDTRYNNVICGAMWDNILEGRTFELAAALHTGKQALIEEFPANENNIVEFNHHIYGTIGDPSIPVWIGEPSNLISDIDTDLNESFIQSTITDIDGNPIEDVVGALMYNGELIAKGLTLSNGELNIDFDNILIGENLDLYLNKPQFFQEHIVLNFSSDNGSNYIVSENVDFDILPRINNQDYAISNEEIDLSLTLFNFSPKDYDNISISLSEITNGVSNDNSIDQENISIAAYSSINTSSIFTGVVNDISKGSSIDFLASVFINEILVGEYQISVMVGPLLSTDPIPPDEYGYWAYDHTDVDYIEHPIYTWIEINPSNGGEGINLGLHDDTLIEIDLDFNFKYYGNNYNSATICSNGWLSFELENIPYFWNFSIPMPLGPSAMIAPFFDDLDDNGYEKCIDENNNGECENAEEFVDFNANGIWDDAEEFVDSDGDGIWDENEEFVDSDGDGVWDDAEEFVDSDGDGVWDDAEYIDLDLDDEWDAGEPFNIFYWYDEINHRIIIQWDNLPNGEDDDLCPNCTRETFQIILNDPNYYETLTGDGEIIFQYKEINDIDGNGNFSTIGIESPDQNDGLQVLFAGDMHISSTPMIEGIGEMAIKFTTTPPDNALLEINQGLIEKFNIVYAYPNPFNPKVNIDYSLESPQHIKLEVFNILGKQVATIENGFKISGKHSVAWDASNFSSGSYFIRLKLENGFFRTSKITHLK